MFSRSSSEQSVPNVEANGVKATTASLGTSSMRVPGREPPTRRTPQLVATFSDLSAGMTLHRSSLLALLLAALSLFGCLGCAPGGSAAGTFTDWFDLGKSPSYQTSRLTPSPLRTAPPGRMIDLAIAPDARGVVKRFDESFTGSSAFLDLQRRQDEWKGMVGR